MNASHLEEDLTGVASSGAWLASVGSGSASTGQVRWVPDRAVPTWSQAANANGTQWRYSAFCPLQTWFSRPIASRRFV